MKFIVRKNWSKDSEIAGLHQSILETTKKIGLAVKEA